MTDRKAYQAEWYLRNRERLLAKAAAYRAEHLEELREKDRNYAATHSAKKVQCVRLWRIRNPEKNRAAQHRHRMRLTDARVRSALGIPDAPVELIAAKRELILAKRVLKELSHETR